MMDNRFLLSILSVSMLLSGCGKGKDADTKKDLQTSTVNKENLAAVSNNNPITIDAATGCIKTTSQSLTTVLSQMVNTSGNLSFEYSVDFSLDGAKKTKFSELKGGRTAAAVTTAHVLKVGNQLSTNNERLIVKKVDAPSKLPKIRDADKDDIKVVSKKEVYFAEFDVKDLKDIDVKELSADTLFVVDSYKTGTGDTKLTTDIKIVADTTEVEVSLAEDLNILGVKSDKNCKVQIKDIDKKIKVLCAQVFAKANGDNILALSKKYDVLAVQVINETKSIKTEDAKKAAENEPMIKEATSLLEQIQKKDENNKKTTLSFNDTSSFVEKSSESALSFGFGKQAVVFSLFKSENRSDFYAFRFNRSLFNGFCVQLSGGVVSNLSALDKKSSHFIDNRTDMAAISFGFSSKSGLSFAAGAFVSSNNKNLVRFEDKVINKNASTAVDFIASFAKKANINNISIESKASVTGKNGNQATLAVKI